MGAGGGAGRSYVPTPVEKAAEEEALLKARLGLTDEQKDQLDDAEEPIRRPWQHHFWHCTSCGAPMKDVWGESLCHKCMAEENPDYHAPKEFSKTLVIHTKTGPKMLEPSGNVSPKKEAVQEDRMVMCGQRVGSKDLHLSRSSSKHESRASSKPQSGTESRDDGGMSTRGTSVRGESKKSMASHHTDGRAMSKSHDARKVRDETFDEAKEAARAAKKALHQSHHAQPLGPEPEAIQRYARGSGLGASDVAPPFSDAAEDLIAQGRAPSKLGRTPSKALVELRASSKHLHEQEGRPGSPSKHHHHHHHNESREELAAQKKAKAAESNLVLETVKDDLGHALAMGDRVIGEGNVGEEMGIGTVVGANISHGHGMVVVMFDESHQQHPMKADKLTKLDPRHEAETLKLLEKKKRDKKKSFKHH